MNSRTKHIFMREKVKGIEFTNAKQQSKILQALNLCRKDEELCDVVLLVQGMRYPAHRAVLMVACDYFKAMFSLKMRENTSTEVPMMELQSSIVEQLLNYIYTGTLNVNKDDVQDLFIASDMLQMEDIKNMCVTYITKNITVSNCIDLYQFGHMFHCQILVDKALHYIRQLYPAVSTTSAFLELSPNTLNDIVQDDHLSLEPDGEVSVLKSIIRWLEKDFSARLSHIPCLLNHVRWKYISEKSVSEVLSQSHNLGNGELKNVIFSANKISMCEPRHMKILVAGGYLQSRTGPDCPRLCSVEVLDLHTLTWNKMTNLPLEGTPPSFIHVMMLSGQLIAICLTYSNKEGKSQFCVGKIYRYNSVLEHWLALEENVQTEHLVNTVWECTKAGGSVLSCHGRVYILSYKGVYHVDLTSSIDDVMVGDVIQLHDVPGYNSARTHRQYMALAVCQGQLYSIGGCDVYSKSEIYPTSDVYQLEEDKQIWQRKADLITARSSMATAVLDDQIFVTGGVNTFRLCSVEKYSPLTDTWTKLRDMHKPRSSHMCLAAQGRIYVLGGKSYSYQSGGARKVLNTSDVYDPDSNDWTAVPQSMSIGRCMAASVIV